MWEKGSFMLVLCVLLCKFHVGLMCQFYVGFTAVCWVLCARSGILLKKILPERGFDHRTTGWEGRQVREHAY